MKVTILKVGGSLSPEKAEEMLHDGTAHGKKLTPKQKRYFGMIAHKKAEDGATLTPIGSGVSEFKGPSHADGGIPFSYGGKKVEVEGKETIHEGDGGADIMSATVKVPGLGKTYAAVSKLLADKEMKVRKRMEEGADLVNSSNVGDKWEILKHNTGEAYLRGGQRKLSEIEQSKDHLVALQRAGLEHAEELGVDPEALYNKGLYKKAKEEFSGKAKYGMRLPKAQSGIQIMIDQAKKTNSQGGSSQQNTPATQTFSPYSPSNEDLINDPHIDKDFKAAYIKMLSEAPDYVRNGIKFSSGFRTYQEQKDLYEAGLKQYGPKLISGKVAKPGFSAHESGLAGDLSFSSPEAKKWLYENSKKYGIDFPLKSTDPNHAVYTANLKGGIWKGPKSIQNDPGFGSEDISSYIPTDYTPISGAKFDKERFKNYTPTEPTKVAPSNYTPQFYNPKPIDAPTNAKPLEMDQVLGEAYMLGTNKQEPVWLQQYTPELYEPYQVSFQDKLNEQKAQFKEVQKIAGNNPSALATLAGQEYGASSSVLGEEFRTNQQIANDITNKNISLLNDAQSKNLSLADQQYVRQATAKSKTKEQNFKALDSISNKLLQREAENNALKVYENLYPNYRFNNSSGKAEYYGPNAVENINWDTANNQSASPQIGPYSRPTRTYDKHNNLISTRVADPSESDIQKNNIDFPKIMPKSIYPYKFPQKKYGGNVVRAFNSYKKSGGSSSDITPIK